MKKINFVVILQKILIVLTTLIVTSPIFIIVYRYVPDIRLPFFSEIKIQYYITLAILLTITYLLLNYFRYIVVGVFSIGVIILGLNTFWGGYSFKNIHNDYKALITYITDKPIEIPFISKNIPMTIRNAPLIKIAADYKNEKVRDFAVKNALKHFNETKLYKEYGQNIRYFSLFKVINKEWTYVYDPYDENYYSKASESIDLLAGDCDDHAIFVCSCIKAIGGHSRLIHTKNHLYPEVRVCHENEFDKINYLIRRKLFSEQSRNKKIYYHVDKKGYVWLNFDYTENYPGGRFMSDEIYGILVL